MPPTPTPASTDIVLDFGYPDGDNVTVAVSGFTRGVSVLHALARAGDLTLIDTVRTAMSRNGASGEPIVLELALDDDAAKVVVAGFRNLERGLEALGQAGSQETFAHVLSVLADRGDTTLLELMDDAD